MRRKQQNENRNKTLSLSVSLSRCLAVCPLLHKPSPKPDPDPDRMAQPPPQKSNSPPLSSPPKSFLVVSSVQQFFPHPPNQGQHRLFPAADLPQNKSLAGGEGGWLWLLWLACLLGDHDYSRPPPTVFPLMAWQEGYEIDGWMLNDATEQRRRETEGGVMGGGVLIPAGFKL